MLLVHVTHFNALMWDSGVTPGARDRTWRQAAADVRWHGRIERGLVVVNNIERVAAAGPGCVP
jgi:hypothetical protein